MSKNFYNPEQSESRTTPSMNTLFDDKDINIRTDFQRAVKGFSIRNQSSNRKTELSYYMSLQIARELEPIEALTKVCDALAYETFSDLIYSLGLTVNGNPERRGGNLYTGGHEHNPTYYNKVHVTVHYYDCDRMSQASILSFLPARKLIDTSRVPEDVLACRSAVDSFDVKLRNEIGIAMLTHIISLPDFLDVAKYPFGNQNDRMVYFFRMLTKYPNLMPIMADSVGMILDTAFVYSEYTYTPDLDYKSSPVPGSDPSHAIQDRIKYHMRKFHLVRACRLLELVFRGRLNVKVDETFHQPKMYSFWMSNYMKSWSDGRDIKKVKEAISLWDLPVRLNYSPIHRSAFRKKFQRIEPMGEEVVVNDSTCNDHSGNRKTTRLEDI
ncbi:9b2f35b4-6f00-4269-a0f2-9c830bd2d99d [Sclerotinia trifoliorum]|uniref:9b2f35b4-6f00-4269-a0f2-9c830bd2d99d n=1 Tax=Sclerotinia trifoliorum TaxID=28548 RepID=A0A8H2W646_9HELO|nr:9b2f35b4-6f00-4269-a0f2-9c830bd2d99d [Sclerotinia trifoliorum]